MTTHITLVFALILLIVVVRALFKQFFNPLNRFPGPRLARWTRYYMAYYDVFKGGAWIEHLQELHRLYGPVVRVAPNELHFGDPRAYGDIYSTSSKFIKDLDMYGAFPFPESVFVQTDPRQLAARKALITPFFSKQAVLNQIEGNIRSTVEKLTCQLAKNHSPGQIPANLNHALRSTTFDVITTYCFATSPDAVSHPGFHSEVLIGMDTALPYVPLAKHFRIVKVLIRKIPDWITPVLSASLRAAVKQLGDVEAMAEKFLANPDAADDSHRTIFHSLWEGTGTGERATKRGSHLVTKEWLADESLFLRFAGSDTVSSTCVVGCRYILAEPTVLRELVEELDNAWPDKNVNLGIEVLEKLPYLTAVIKESLRLSHGVVSPMTRIISSGGAAIAGHFVPEGTSVAIANSFVHLNTDIFPEPGCFLPERWLQPGSQDLEKHLVAFGRGPRSCPGINLAWCEMYLIFGSIFRKLNLTLPLTFVHPGKQRTVLSLCTQKTFCKLAPKKGCNISTLVSSGSSQYLQ
ncbi:cytochrome P450 [Dendrothele bispora CBS 962.96]|uniref:Cytochrome P450 n=1 Tax=Dendrothele bispora (strain CBS 962.96) TaxID=1314807 RepID=A0A4S8MJA6_DENBC|nr:cytochrome P450 [Dendrothele bispora CBS 962.96]